MEPVVARKWVGEVLAKQFQLGVYRDKKLETVSGKEPPRRSAAEVVGITAESDISVEAREESRRTRTRETTVKVAGFGGQGVLLLGQLLAEMGLREHMEVSWLPSYGPEMRSGSCHCHVSLAHQRIGSPVISHPEVLLAMNEPSLRKFGPQVAPGGLIIYNRDRLPEDFAVEGNVRVICVPASEIADSLGSAKVANVVMLGAMLQETECLPMESVMSVLTETVHNPKMLELDRQALEAGHNHLNQ
jgi:2-oxoisovalerate ferredoxin oxidoreductase beta subunit